MDRLNYRGYYAANGWGKRIVYVENILIGIGRGDVFTIDHDPDTLQGIALMFSKKYLMRDDFLKNDWDIVDIEIPSHFIKGILEANFNNQPLETIENKYCETIDFMADIAEVHLEILEDMRRKKRRKSN